MRVQHIRYDLLSSSKILITYTEMSKSISIIPLEGIIYTPFPGRISFMSMGDTEMVCYAARAPEYILYIPSPETLKPERNVS